MSKPDIVERLRRLALPDPYDERGSPNSPLLREAADLIEALMEIPRYSRYSADASDTSYGWLCMGCGHQDQRASDAIEHMAGCPVDRVEQLMKDQ